MLAVASPIRGLASIGCAGLIFVCHSFGQVPRGRAVQDGESDKIAAMNRKLGSIILPHVEFRDTKLADAVEFLRQHGANVVVKAPAAAGQPRLTLSLDRIPLLEAIRYVAAQAAMKVKVEAYAVSLVPPGEENEQQVTAVFTVKPDFFNFHSDAAPTR